MERFRDVSVRHYEWVYVLFLNFLCLFMDRRAVRKIKDAKDKARPELKHHGWDTLHLDEKVDLSPKLVVDNIQRVDGRRLSVDEFRRRFEIPRVPVVLTGLTDNWPANDKWTVRKLAKKYRNQKFKCGEDDDGYSVRLKMKYFVDYIKHTNDDSPLYIFDSSFGERKKVKKLLDDYTVPEFFSDDLFGYADDQRRPPYRWFVMGPRLSGTGVHIDPLGTSAWNALISGHKRWSFLPTETPRDLVKPTKMEGGKHYTEAVVWFQTVNKRIESGQWPDDLKPISCVQNPGEIVFVPGGWWHVVLNLDTTIAVTQNFASPVNLPLVWQKTVKGRPRFSKHWYKKLKSLRPEMAAICDRAPEIQDSVQSDSSSDSSSSSSSSETDSSDDDSSQNVQIGAQREQNGLAADDGRALKRKSPCRNGTGHSPVSKKQLCISKDTNTESNTGCPEKTRHKHERH